jgi:hypothetical protein
MGDFNVVVLFGTSFTESSRTAVTDFSAKKRSRLIIHFVHEYALTHTCKVSELLMTIASRLTLTGVSGGKLGKSTELKNSF